MMNISFLAYFLVHMGFWSKLKTIWGIISAWFLISILYIIYMIKDWAITSNSQRPWEKWIQVQLMLCTPQGQIRLMTWSWQQRYISVPKYNQPNSSNNKQNLVRGGSQKKTTKVWTYVQTVGRWGIFDPYFFKKKKQAQNFCIGA